MRRVRRYDEWFPEQTGTVETKATDLRPGQVVALDFKPMRIIRICEKPFATWPEKELAHWREAGEPQPECWAGRWMDIEYRVDRPGEKLRLGGANASFVFLVLPEHYAICSQCGQLPPCRDELTDRIMKVEARRIEFEMQLSHGDCHGCGKRVSPREHSTLYPGENLVRPDLGANTAVFHTRQSCISIALAYQDRWLAADPERTPRIHAHA